MKVLVIDREEAIRIGACAILAMNGFDADMAADEKEAAAMLSLCAYDVVITAEDLCLPRGAVVKRLNRPYTAHELIKSIDI